MRGNRKARAEIYHTTGPGLNGLALVRIEAENIDISLLSQLNGIGFNRDSDPGPCTVLSALLHAYELHNSTMRRIRRPELIALMLIYGVNQLRELPAISSFTVAYALGEPDRIIDTLRSHYDVEVSDKRLECGISEMAAIAARAAVML